jgi:arylsulfatase A-like enzyme
LFYGAAGGALAGFISLSADPLGAFSVLHRQMTFEMNWFVAAGLAGCPLAFVSHLLLRKINKKPEVKGFSLVGWLESLVSAIVPFWLVMVLRHSSILFSGWLSMVVLAAVFLVIHALLLILLPAAWQRWERLRGVWLLPWCAFPVLIILSLNLMAIPRGQPAENESPNVVLVVMDTTRADRLSLHGYQRKTSEALEQLARRGRCYTQCYSTSSWTIPAHASMFTGLYPVRHRATQETLLLDEQFDTLAEILASDGYQTLGLSTNPAVAERFGLAQGFQVFLDMWRDGMKQHYSPAGVHPVNSAVEEFLRKRRQSEPFFMFINYIEPHVPYRPPEAFLIPFLEPGQDAGDVYEYSGRKWPVHYLDRVEIPPAGFDAMGRLYDGEVAHLDTVIEDLEGLFDLYGLSDDTLLIVTSDHGENLGDHGHLDHVFSLYNTTLHVPLVVLDPHEAQPGRRVETPVQVLDLFPAILRYAGLQEAARDSQGMDLAAAERAEKRPMLAEYYFPSQVLSVCVKYGGPEKMKPLQEYMRRLRSIQWEGMKFIWASDGRHELYHLEEDPEELHNLISEEKYQPVVADLQKRLDESIDKYSEGIPLPPEPASWDEILGFEQKVDQESREELRSLGYLR